MANTQTININDPDYQHFYGNEGLWRNDYHTERNKYDNQPTISRIVIHAEDKIYNGKHYGFGIRHVRGFRGKGFMPFFWFILCPGASGGNGELFYGTDKFTYNKALADGLKLVKDHDERMEKDLSNHKNNKSAYPKED
jgi:hypothetical protein